MNPENSENSFKELIRHIINNFHYTTIASLQSIVKDIESLPDHERAANSADIVKIKGAIKGYGQVDRPLTNNQIKALNKELYKIISPVKMSEYEPYTYCGSREPYTYTNSWPIEQEKLGKDEFIYEVLVNLIQHLSGVSLSSSVTLLVSELEELLLQLTQFDDKKYGKLYEKISVGLKVNGWTTGKGFYSEPNKDQLLNLMNSTVCMYFEA